MAWRPNALLWGFPRVAGRRAAVPLSLSRSGSRASINYKRIGSPELQELERMSTNRITMPKTSAGTSNRRFWLL
jgi:hypothetical protein